MAFGALANGALAGHAAYLAAIGAEGWGVSVEVFLTGHHTWLGWTRDWANAILPADFVDWIFALPALVLFPLRMLIAVFLAKLCFAGARGAK